MDEWTVKGTLHELPDQTYQELLVRPKELFPLPFDDQRVNTLIPDNVKELHQQLQYQRQQREAATAMVDAMNALRMSEVKMTDGECRKQKQLNRLREKLKNKKEMK